MNELAPLVLADAARVGALAAELVVNRLLARPRARLLLPLEPDALYAALRAHPGLRSAGATVLALDEAAGGRAHAERLQAQLRGVPLAALRTPDGAAADLEAEAARYGAELEAAPIDLAVLVLRPDGGVALDAPPASRASGVRVVPGGVTVGLGTLYLTRELLVLATGAAVAPALRAMLEARPSSPAALLRDHPRVTVACDREAAALLTPRPQFAGDRVLIVLGHREPGISPEHRISHESRARLRHARELAERTPVRAVVLTGYTSTGGLSEAEQMKTAWDEGLAPALLEVAGRNTAENASRSLPIVLALGDVRRVTVVSSAWHVRVPFFFAPYRRYRLEVAYRASFAHGAWPRMLAQELRSLPHAPAARRAALAAMRLPRRVGP